MKSIGTKMTVFSFILIFAVSLFAQEQGDYQTRDSGNWSSAAIWEMFNGSVWGAIGSPPSGAETITVLSEDSVFCDVAVSISDTLINQGIVEPNDNLTFADGGVYQHDQDIGTIPISTWEVGSTLYMTGTVSDAPEDRDQDYYNMVFNTPDLMANLNMDLNDNTISGDITVISTGIMRWYLTSALALDTAVVTIMGDVIVLDGSFSVQGTGNAYTYFFIHHYGNIEVTGGNFSISRGSQPLGTTTWYLYEGDFSMSNATTQNSNTTVDGAKFVFTKEGTQKLTLGEGNTLSSLPIEVASGTTLDMGASQLEGSGNFTVNENAMIMTSLAGGVNEIFKASYTGQKTLAYRSGYGFNGTEAQITSTLMPDTVNILTIDNAAGVTLSQETYITDELRLLNGQLDNTIPFTLGPGASVIYEGGSLLLGIKSSEVNIPKKFFMDQNYPNPFNPLTTIRFGLPISADVTVKIFNLLGQEVATPFEGHLNVGEHVLQFNAETLSSGVYLYRIQAGDFVSIKRMVLMK